MQQLYVTSTLSVPLIYVLLPEVAQGILWNRAELAGRPGVLAIIAEIAARQRKGRVYLPGVSLHPRLENPNRGEDATEQASQASERLKEAISQFVTNRGGPAGALTPHESAVLTQVEELADKYERIPDQEGPYAHYDIRDLVLRNMVDTASLATYFDLPTTNLKTVAMLLANVPEAIKEVSPMKRVAPIVYMLKRLYEYYNGGQAHFQDKMMGHVLLKILEQDPAMTEFANEKLQQAATDIIQLSERTTVPDSDGLLKLVADKLSEAVMLSELGGRATTRRARRRRAPQSRKSRSRRARRSMPRSRKTANRRRHAKRK